MKNTNTIEFRAKVFAYLCDAAYDLDAPTQEDAARHIRERFETEFNYEQNKRRYPNAQARVADWLAGLPLAIAYTYHDITKTATEWHGCELTEQQADVIQERWFSFLAFKLLQLWRAHNLEEVR